jgi:protein ImuB
MSKSRKKTPANTLPVHRLLEILHQWGIHTLGDLGRLDKEELRTRLGSEAVMLWERANGESVRPLKFVQPSESYEESFEFEHEVETVDPLLFMLRRFLQQLTLRFNAIYLVARELTLHIEFANKKRYERHFKIPQPTNDIDLLFRMLHTHLENFKSDHPIIALSLKAEPVRPAAQQFGLFETALRDPNRLCETLARLTGLLGQDRVGTPVREETHRADAFHLEPFSWQLSHETGTGRISSHHPARSEKTSRAALRRFRPGLPASVLLEENKPVHLRSEEITGTALNQNGPYLGSGNWWDEKAWARMEWDLCLERGALLRCHQNPSGWQVDGIYD